MFLAELLRLGILPEGYIYPRAERAVRDLARKRAKLVQQRTTNILSIQSSVQRNTGVRLKNNQIKALKPCAAAELVTSAELALALGANVRVRQCLDDQIGQLEKAIPERVKLCPEFAVLQSVPGVGRILALTIMLEAGPIERFAEAVRNVKRYWLLRNEAP